MSSFLPYTAVIGSIDNIGDFSISSPEGGQVLVYNSSNGKWENADDSGSTGANNSITSVSITGQDLQFTKGDGSSSTITIPTQSVTHPTNNFVGVSISGNILTLTDRDNNNTNITLPSESQDDYVSSSISGSTITFTKRDATTDSITLPAAATDKFLNSASLSGTTLSLAMADGTTQHSVDLASLTTDTKVQSIAIVSNDMIFTLSDSSTISVDISTLLADIKLQGLSLDAANNKIVATLSDGNTTEVDLSPIIPSVATDVYASSSVVNANDKSTITLVKKDATIDSIEVNHPVAYSNAVVAGDNILFTKTDGTNQTITLNHDSHNTFESVAVSGADLVFTKEDGTTQTITPQQPTIPSIPNSYVSSSITGNTIFLNKSDGSTTDSLSIPAENTDDFTDVSISSNTLSFQRRDATTKDITLPSFTESTNDYVSSSITGNTITLTKRDASSDTIVLPAETPESTDDYISSSITGSVITLTKRSGGTDTITLPAETPESTDDFTGASITGQDITLTRRSGTSPVSLTIPSSTDKYLNTATLSGTILSLAMADGTTTHSVDLSSLTTDTKVQSIAIVSNDMIFTLSDSSTISVDIQTLLTDIKLQGLSLNGTSLEATLSDGSMTSVDFTSLFDAKYDSIRFLLGTQLELRKGLNSPEYIDLSDLKVSNAQMAGTNLNLTIGANTISADLSSLANTLVNVKPTNVTLTGTDLTINLSDNSSLTVDLEDLEEKELTNLALSNPTTLTATLTDSTGSSVINCDLTSLVSYNSSSITGKTITLNKTDSSTPDTIVIPDDKVRAVSLSSNDLIIDLADGTQFTTNLSSIAGGVVLQSVSFDTGTGELIFVKSDGNTHTLPLSALTSVIDTTLSSTSTNAVENRIVKAELDLKTNNSDNPLTSIGLTGTNLVSTDINGTTTTQGTFINVIKAEQLSNVSIAAEQVGQVLMVNSTTGGASFTNQYVKTDKIYWDSGTDLLSTKLETVLEADAIYPRLNGTQLEFKRMDGTVEQIQLSSLGTDTKVSSAAIVGNNLNLTLTDSSVVSVVIDTFLDDVRLASANWKDSNDANPYQIELVVQDENGTTTRTDTLDLSADFNAKQDVISYDTTPTPLSDKLIKSKDLKTLFDDKQDTLTYDTSPTPLSDKLIKSKDLKTLFDAKEALLSYDTTPTPLSDKLIKSKDLKTLFDDKQDTLTFDPAPTSGNTTNVVSSDVLYTTFSTNTHNLTHAPNAITGANELSWSNGYSGSPTTLRVTPFLSEIVDVGLTTLLTSADTGKILVYNHSTEIWDIEDPDTWADTHLPRVHDITYSNTTGSTLSYNKGDGAGGTTTITRTINPKLEQIDGVDSNLSTGLPASPHNPANIPIIYYDATTSLWRHSTLDILASAGGIASKQDTITNQTDLDVGGITYNNSNASSATMSGNEITIDLNDTSYFIGDIVAIGNINSYKFLNVPNNGAQIILTCAAASASYVVSATPTISAGDSHVNSTFKKNFSTDITITNTDDAVISFLIGADVSGSNQIYMSASGFT